MKQRLLDQQTVLLEHLTSGELIFGEGSSASTDRRLRGIDAGLLRLEAFFSHEKRLAKIAAVLPRTFALLGSERTASLREFAQLHPPVGISGIDNAQQFREFLSARQGRGLSNLPYLPDLAACELAYVRVTRRAEQPSAQSGAIPSGALRRHRSVILLRCAYDVRSTFETGFSDVAPVKRDIALAVLMPLDAARPSILELNPVVYELLQLLDEYVHPAEFSGGPEGDILLAGLVADKLVEVHG